MAKAQRHRTAKLSDAPLQVDNSKHTTLSLPSDNPDWTRPLRILRLPPPPPRIEPPQIKWVGKFSKAKMQPFANALRVLCSFPLVCPLKRTTLLVMLDDVIRAVM